jgi:hypothetical protein
MDFRIFAKTLLELAGADAGKGTRCLTHPDRSAERSGVALPGLGSRTIQARRQEGQHVTVFNRSDVACCGKRTNRRFGRSST